MPDEFISNPLVGDALYTKSNRAYQNKESAAHIFVREAYMAHGQKEPSDRSVEIDKSMMAAGNRFLSKTNMLSPEDQADFKDLVKGVGDRATSKGWSDNEVAKFYEETARLLANTVVKSGISQTSRVELAKQLMKHTIAPELISQGNHNTCTVSTVESRIFSRDPSDAAELVADVAITGEYIAKSGIRVTLDKDSLKPGLEVLKTGLYNNNRDYSSQLFQVTAVNLHYQQKDPTIVYQQIEPQLEKAGDADGKDSGERLIYANDGREVGSWPVFLQKLGASPAGARNPKLNADATVDIGNMISGEKDRSWMLTSENVHSVSQLEELLAQAKLRGNLPLVLQVNTGNEPFLNVFGKNLDARTGGWHVVSITDYDTSSSQPRISITNQWNFQDNHVAFETQLSPEMLYYSLRSPDDKNQAEEMSEELKSRKIGEPHNYSLTFEMLRKEELSGLIDKSQYYKSFESELIAFNADVSYSKETLDQPQSVIINATNSMPEEERNRMDAVAAFLRAE